PRVLAVLALPLLVACPPKAPPEEVAPPEVDPVALLAKANAEAAPGPSAVSFDLRLETPDQNVNANGALVVAPPDRFRIEVRGPIGPAQLVVVGDGEGIVAWVASKNQFVTAPGADAKIRAYTGGEVGLEALASLLLGRLPALKQPDLVKPGGVPSYRWSGPGESHLDAALDPRTAHLVALALADEAGAVVMEADVEGKAWPERLDVRIPSKGVVAMLSFGEWRPAEPPDAAFVLTPPEGATVMPLDLGAPDAAPAPDGAPGPTEAPPSPEH
ncbi:MAG: LolA family protein, partial [Myxococcota bacterium]